MSNAFRATEALVCLLLLCALFAPVLWNMGREWLTLEEMGHGIFVPFVVAYVCWTQRERLRAMEIQPSYWGLVLVVLGAMQMVVASLGAEFFLARSAFLVCLVGLIWTVAGLRMVRALLFPLILLAFMVRWPTIVYSQITFPLQLFASKVAEWGLTLLEIPVLREGNVLELANRRLSVVEACSGIRSLLSLSFLALVYAYMFDKKAWMRVALLIAAVPIAVVANAGRVTLTGVLTAYWPDLAEGFYHSFEGWMIFVFALLILVAAHGMINRVYARASRS